MLILDITQSLSICVFLLISTGSGRSRCHVHFDSQFAGSSLH